MHRLQRAAWAQSGSWAGAGVAAEACSVWEAATGNEVWDMTPVISGVETTGQELAGRQASGDGTLEHVLE